MWLHENAVNVINGDDLFGVSTGFNQTGITQVSTESEVALGRSYDNFDCPSINGIDAKSDSLQFFDNVGLKIIIIQGCNGGGIRDTALDILIDVE